MCTVYYEKVILILQTNSPILCICIDKSYLSQNLFTVLAGRSVYTHTRKHEHL